MLTALLGLAWPAAADEIRLRSGKTISGEIVSFEENMFKVKTDFGFVLIEKSKIASILPSKTKPKAAAKPGEKPTGKPAAEKENASDKSEKRETPRIEPAPAGKAETKTEKAADSPPPAAKVEKKEEKTAASSAPPAQTIPMTPDSSSAPATRVSVPTAPAAAPVPATASASSAGSSPANSPAASPALPPVAQPPQVREDVQGNIYTNHTHGFRFYKAPGWHLIEDARRALPNAVVAMGTEDHSTMLIAGLETAKEPLDAAAAAIEERLREGYENYRHLEKKKTQVGGLPAVEIRYRGVESEHDWSGRLVVVARGKEYFTILGITFADSDLIQIQENVISRTIASLDFHAQ
ncbi:MAG: hypothetical protein LAN71_03830 [Acidobacteriia bacterium]|nr:hypothetical protein [Terriglobia bacterium]